MKQKKASTYRFYPDDKQKSMLARTFGCCRYVYNWALRQRTDAYYQRGERLSYEDTAQRLVLLKKQEGTLWLGEVSSVPLQQSLRHLDRAFRNSLKDGLFIPPSKRNVISKLLPMQVMPSHGMDKPSRLPRWMHP